MPDSDADNRNSDSSRNLPIPVVRPTEARDSESWMGRILRSLFGWKSGSIRADLENVLDAATPSETGFSPAESRMLRNILGLRERRVDDVMIPRADIVAVQRDIILGELVKIFEGAAHSRLVVYGDTLDDPLGMVHIRDLIAFMTKKASGPPKSKRRKAPVAGLDFSSVDLSLPLSSIQIMRSLIYVPPSMPAIDLLARMQATRIHLALVIDEYGGTDGLVSMEDIVEQVVGDIEDEHDEASIHTIVRQYDGSYLSDGRANLDEVVTAIGSEFDVGDAGQEVDTLGGYVVKRIGRVPVRGELVPGPDRFEFEILDADPRRIKKIRIYRSKKPVPAAPAEAAKDATAAPAAEPSPEPRTEESAREAPTPNDSPR
ncbi:MAG TPA: hemolysin family protein [Xanthobacteraceae bacterium]|nr:hemolysin family protein [Xanthobacteraceae bacterium]